MSETSFVIKRVDRSSADAVPAVFRSIYGDEFPMKYVYHADRIMAEIDAGRLDSSLAFDAAGEPVGYVAIYKNAPNPRLWEGGNLLVIPGKGYDSLAWRLLQHYKDPENLPDSGSDGLFGEAVCHHFFTQVGCAKLDFADCALSLDQLNGASFREHAPKTERVACLLQFYEQSDPSGACHLPGQYYDILSTLSEQLRPRTLLPGSAPLPATGITSRSDRYYADAAMWRVEVSAIGGDWGAFLDGLLEEARRRNVVSLQVVLSAAMPCATAAVAEMRRRGFFLGGLFPRWFGDDAVMMQQVLGREPDYDGIRLYTRIAKSLLEFIRADREAVRHPGR